MMNFNSSQNSQTLSFISSKHDTHDEEWLLPGLTTSFFCFACTIECLEDKSTLNIRKKRIATEFLEILLVNKNIGRVIGSKQDVFFHLLNLFVCLLWESTDAEFKEIISQCCLHTVKQTNPLHANSMIFESILERKNFPENFHLLKLLCSLLQITPTLSELFFRRKGAYIDEIIKCTSGCNSNNLIYLWNLLALIFKSGVRNENNTISHDRVLAIIKNGIENINTSFVVGIEIHVLHCFQYFAESRYYRMIMFDHECSKLTSSTLSIVEILKKMLLSSKEELELNAVLCISSICNPQYEVTAENTELASLVALVLEKGLSEFLLELLLSAKELVVCELFKCLCKLTRSKAFCKMGHMVYGFTAIINAIKKVEASSNTDAFFEGLVLLESMLTKGVFLDHSNQLYKQSCVVLELLSSAFNKPQSKLKYVVVSSFCVYLSLVSVLVQKDFETTLNLIESIFTYMEKEINVINANVDKKTLQFIVHSYEAVYFMIQIIFKENVKIEKAKGTQETDISSSSNSQLQTSQHLDPNLFAALVDNIYFICDKYLIPQAIMKYFPLNSLPLQSIFYRALHSIIELSVEKGKLLASKLAESSFFRFIYDFKVVVTAKDTNEVLSNLLVVLCLSDETSQLRDWLQKSLLSWFANFNVPFSEWQFLLVQSSLSNQMTSDFLGEARSCMFAMLAYSQKANSPLITMNLMKIPLENFAECKENLTALPILGKRYFLYLWSHMQCLHVNVSLNECALRHVIDMVDKELERSKNLFMNSDVVLIWVLKNNISLDVQKSFFELYFNDIIQNDELDEKIQSLITNINSHRLSSRFIEMVLLSIESSLDPSILDVYISTVSVLLQSISSDTVISLKTIIYKVLMKNKNTMDHSQLVALFKCSIGLQICCGKEINDDDLKLFCTTLNMLIDHTAPSLRFQLLHYVSIIIAKSVKLCNPKPTSVALGCNELLNEFQTTIFTNRNFITNSQTSCLLENINGVCIMIISELLSGTQLLAADVTNEAVKVHIDLLIEALVAHEVPIIQIAALSFWKKMCDQKFRSLLVVFTNESNDAYTITQKDVDLLYIALQNLYYNSKELIRERAVICLHSLMQCLAEPRRLLDQPWSKKLIQLCSDKIPIDPKDLASLNLLALCIKYSERCRDETFKTIIDLLKRRIDEDNVQGYGFNETICLAETAINVCIKKIDYTKLKDLKILLKTLHHKYSQNSQSGMEEKDMTFISINELVMIRDADIDVMQTLECIRKTKIAVCEQISAIDDETDSGEDD